MLTTQTIAVYPNKAQLARLERYLLVGRLAFNRALEARRSWYAKTGKGISYYDQCADLTELRAADPFWQDVPLEVERDGMRRCDLAFRAFFRRLKAKKGKAGFPRFKAAQRWNSFSLNTQGKIIVGNRIRVPGIKGTLRAKNLRTVVGTIKTQILVRRAGRWFCYIVANDGKIPAESLPIRSAVGIDMGLTSFATLSTGQKIDNPRFLKGIERKLANAGRGVSRCKRGSKRRRRAVDRLERVHVRLANLRHNFVHQESAHLAREHQLIAVEKLQIKNMVRSRLAKSITDACWRKFIDCLTYKAERAGGRVVAVNPAGTTQECSGCGEIVPKDLSVRMHVCGCGLVLDRDENAARNILRRALETAPSSGRADVTDAEGCKTFGIYSESFPVEASRVAFN